MQQLQRLEHILKTLFLLPRRAALVGLSLREPRSVRSLPGAELNARRLLVSEDAQACPR
jgi:hypothetical protein